MSAEVVAKAKVNMHYLLEVLYMTDKVLLLIVLFLLRDKQYQTDNGEISYACNKVHHKACYA